MGIGAPGDVEDAARRRQSSYFCTELNRHADGLYRDIDRLKATLARQSSRVELGAALHETRCDLEEATAELGRVATMLAALGHAYPCPACP